MRNGMFLDLYIYLFGLIKLLDIKMWGESLDKYFFYLEIYFNFLI